ASPAGDTVAHLFGGSFSDVESFAGVAIVADAATAAQGTWQYQVGGAGAWTAVPTGASDSSALVLGPTDALRFVPTGSFIGTPGGLTARLWDGTQGSAGAGRDLTGLIGGTGAFSSNANEVALG